MRVARGLLRSWLPPLVVFAAVAVFLPDVLFLAFGFAALWLLLWLLRRPRYARGLWLHQLFPDPPHTPGAEASRALAGLDRDRMWGKVTREEYERRRRDILDRFMKA
jgi:hypothetical protein